MTNIQNLTYTDALKEAEEIDHIIGGLAYDNLDWRTVKLNPWDYVETFRPELKHFQQRPYQTGDIPIAPSPLEDIDYWWEHYQENHE